MFDKCFSISIFAYRETKKTLLTSINKCIIAAAKTSKSTGTKVIINVLINGNEDLFNQIEQDQSQLWTHDSKLQINIYYFPFGDKANTWNQYFHYIGPNAKFHVFIDGYVFVHSDTFEKIANEYKTKAFLGATGVPTSGRSASALRKSMLRYGGIHGNLCIFTDIVKNEICKHNFFIPVGLYRTDPLIAAIVNFNFAPKSNEWDNSRIRVIENLTWDIESKKYFSLSFIMGHYKRLKRQIQGQFENQAIRNLLAVKKIEISDLPPDVETLLAGHFEDIPPNFIEKFISPLKQRVRNDIENKIIEHKYTRPGDLKSYKLIQKPKAPAFMSRGQT